MSRHGPFRVLDVAAQAGLSEATVDRVLHGRPGASIRATRAVEAAIAELERQASQVRLSGVTLVLDLVIQAPERFSTQVRHAVETELPTLRPATMRARTHTSQVADARAVVGVLDRIERRPQSAAGVLLKAPDDPSVAAAVDRLVDRGIPVVTLVTDVRSCRRVAYAGPDNTAAGATAATLVHGYAGGAPGVVLATISRSVFFGERERLEGFLAELARVEPEREVVVLADADGLDEGVAGAVRTALDRRPDVVAVYSIGGGNRAIVAELDAAGVRPRIHLGHDLDEDNLALLRSGRLDIALHHDLRADVRWAARQVLRHHRALPGAPTTRAAPVEVVTRHNIPWRLTQS